LGFLLLVPAHAQLPILLEPPASTRIVKEREISNGRIAGREIWFPRLEKEHRDGGKEDRRTKREALLRRFARDDVEPTPPSRLG
jgi:hypothetical protein